MAVAVTDVSCPAAGFTVSWARFERSGGAIAQSGDLFMSIRARQIAMITTAMAMMIGMSMWMRSTWGLTSDRAYGFSGVFTWAVAIIIVGQRYARVHLSLSDYHAIHSAGFGALLQGAMASGFALGPSGDDPSTVLACLAMVPALAIDTISLRALFSREEREILESHRGWWRAKSATDGPAKAESIS
ncbi:hypothetical protein MKK64_15375 [Methylobacterium sp. E-025]|uniref:hypothetical protein n=1 Tax=unclassified Methylobacterium TaxID=2615210 RepID=UPI001FBB0AEC|nr:MULTISPECIES: hypothetical protein [unclassified Methylobacterium]MCJ2007380.1 hypothetical protein [Methylobacterium sp. J-092]MCJ2041807.1 hypothetical protein [Methylobacterium sp. J-059]MCJ2112566.1 hypothetical protein [Methylobacterium sp. E-025]